MIGLGVLAGVMSVLGGVAAGGLLVAAGVLALVPVVGMAGAMAVVAAGLVGVIAVVWVAVAMRWRRARAARQAARQAMPLLALAEVALALLPRRRLVQLEAALAAGVALAVVLQQALRREA